jgi:hypothetical protein
LSLSTSHALPRLGEWERECWSQFGGGVAGTVMREIVIAFEGDHDGCWVVGVVRGT